MELPPCNIHIDREGVWYYGDQEITRKDIIEQFYQCMRLGLDGNYIIEIGNNRCRLDVADTPFVISGVDRTRSRASGEEIILLGLKNLSDMEILIPETLYVGEGDVLYCRIREGLFPARFSRPAYYQIADWIVENPETGGFFLELNGIRYRVEMRDPNH